VQFSYAPTSIAFMYELEDGGLVEGGYKIPFGRYFLLAFAGIVLLGLSKKTIYALLILHLSGLILLNMCFYLGIYAYIPLVLGADLLSKYIIPLASFVTVAIGFIMKRNQHTTFLKPDSESNPSDT
jgi:hypothetical protein